jgi:hypothetical protein
MCRGHGEPNIRNEDIHLHRRNADTHYSNEAISEDLRRQKNRQYWWNKKNLSKKGRVMSLESGGHSHSSWERNNRTHCTTDDNNKNRQLIQTNNRPSYYREKNRGNRNREKKKRPTFTISTSYYKELPTDEKTWSAQKNSTEYQNRFTARELPTLRRREVRLNITSKNIL